MSLDLQIFYVLNNLAGQSALVDKAIVFCGSYLAYLLMVVFLVFVIRVFPTRMEQVRAVVVAAVATIIASFGIAEATRFFYHRPRPFVDHTVHKLLSDVSSTEWSFPSGHSTFFFALSTVVYLYNRKWGIGFFAATILIVLGRIAAGVHYPSDIIAGAVIGVLVGYFTFGAFQKFLQK